MTEIVTLCPLQVGAFAWRPQRGGYALTILCKATFTLSPGEAQPRADVVVVGSAFVPRGQPAQSVTVNLALGEINKSLNVIGDRAPGAPVPFENMPLRWERAAGGPGTANPVGVRPGTPPNVVPVGAFADPRMPVEPIGLGPIAPSWPGRIERLGGLSAAWLRSAWTEAPLPASLDPAFFNMAPADQQAKAIRPNDTLMLEGLRPDRAHFVTRLPGISPCCFVDRSTRMVPCSGANPVSIPASSTAGSASSTAPPRRLARPPRAPVGRHSTGWPWDSS